MLGQERPFSFCAKRAVGVGVLRVRKRERAALGRRKGLRLCVVLRPRSGTVVQRTGATEVVCCK